MVRLAISAANSSSVRYSGENGSPANSISEAVPRRSSGRRSRSDGTRAPSPSSASSQPKSLPICHRSANSERTAHEALSPDRAPG